MAAADEWSKQYDEVSAPARSVALVTPNDSTDLSYATKALYVGVGGNISIDTVGGDSAVILIGVPTGSILPIRATRVRATGTTATDIAALY
jgi:hypothetical protein